MNNIEIGLANIFVGMLIVILCIPLIKRKIKMNKWYGMRFQKSFESDKNWYEINEYGGKIFIIWSFLIIVAGVISLFIPQQSKEGTILLSLAPLIVIIPAIQLFVHSRKI